MTFTTSEISSYYADRVPALKQSAAKEWRGPCPVHGGKDLNFAVDSTTGLAKCHSRCGTGWDILSLEMALTGKDFPAAKTGVFRTVGRPDAPYDERDIEATYEYHRADGTLAYQVVRKTGKRFLQRRPNPNGGWIWGLGDTTPLPFELPRLIEADFVAIVEGEKDAVNVSRLGVRPRNLFRH